MFQSQDYLNRACFLQQTGFRISLRKSTPFWPTSYSARDRDVWKLTQNQHPLRDFIITSYFADVKSVHEIHPDCEWMEAGVLKGLGSEAAPLKTVITNSVSRQTWCFCCSPKRWPHLRMKRFCKHTKWEYSKYLKNQQLTSNHDAYR